MSIASLFHLSYFFDNNQTSTFAGFWFLVGVLAAMLVVGYLVSWKAGKMPSPMRQVAQRLSKASVLIGWLGLLWMFFRYQGADYLEWRLWPTVLVIYLLWQIWLVIRFVRVEHPKKVANREAVGEKEMWLKKYRGKRK